MQRSRKSNDGVCLERVGASMSMIRAFHLVQDTTGQRTLMLYDAHGSRAIRSIGEMCERKLMWWLVAHEWTWRVRVYDDRPQTVIYGERK